jgi:hypothetical protein
MARKWAVEAKNLRQMKLAFKDIMATVDPTGKLLSESRGKAFLASVGKTITDAYLNAALMIRDAARLRASAGGAPRRLYEGSRPAIFAFADFDAGRDDKRKRSSLVGVRTGLSYFAKDERLFVRWGEGSRRRKDGTVATRGLSMSLGAIFERGTQNRRIKPIRYFRGAIHATRGKVLTKLAEAYRLAGYKLNGKDLAA